MRKHVVVITLDGGTLPMRNLYLFLSGLDDVPIADNVVELIVMHNDILMGQTVKNAIPSLPEDLMDIATRIFREAFQDIASQLQQIGFIGATIQFNKLHVRDILLTVTYYA